MSNTLEVIVLGSGPSGGLPTLGCITGSSNATAPACRCCTSIYEKGPDDVAAGGRKNRRGNTSCVVRKTWPDGRQSCVMIDCGKTFAQNAIEYFPAHGLRKLDAVILSHDHADAIHGIDDLRMLTRSRLKNGDDMVQVNVPIYCDAKTLAVLRQRFPFWVSQESSVGLTTAGNMSFHIIEPHKLYNIAGIDIIPVEVEHGLTIKQVSPAEAKPTMTEDTSGGEGVREERKGDIVPYLCLAFLVDDKLLWMTDVGKISEKAWNIFRYGLSSALESQIKRTNSHKRRLPVAFVDLSENFPLRAHLSPRTFLQVVDKLEAIKTFAIGMNHTLCHGEIEALGEEVEGVREGGREEAFIQDTLYGGEKVAEGGLFDSLKQKKLHFRPAYDGMSIML
ncbi:hypothetical protein QFC21_002222 [Naganishia friedmannii]|uniref:Uncharacterized protein n=1 Tax=Naganishia friedmannii TaxID=89922 RepID=A0ACC2VXD7_9TREE|nr:hypothetical protein QFC21_002222 [Naganishia friedmannii]